MPIILPGVSAEAACALLHKALPRKRPDYVRRLAELPDELTATRGTRSTLTRGQLARHAESDARRSHDSVTGGAGGPAASQAWSALISEPGFFLDIGKARLLVNSSPQPGGPVSRDRSMIGLKSLTFSVSNHRLSALAHANTSSSDLERRSGRSAIAITS